MRSRFSLLSCAAAGVIALAAQSTHAATIVNLLGDTGTLRNETYAPPAITSVTLINPYGAPPLPTVVPIVNGVSLTFTVTSDFMTFANSNSGGKTQTMDGKLDLLITFSAPVHLTTNLVEDGLWSKVGTGTVDVTGGIVVNEADHVLPVETHGKLFGAETYDPSGTWKLVDQVTGFSGSYTTYRVSIDNTLISEALGAPGSSAFLAKKDFTLVFTTDGSNGSGQPGLPEPASIGVLALGGLALIARRRSR